MQQYIYEGKTIVTAVLLTGFIALLLFPSCCNTPRKPNSSIQAGLNFTTDTLDIGTLRMGEQKTFTIGVNNHSDTPVTIQKFVSSCKCLLVDSQAVTLPAGAAWTLKASLEVQPDEKGQVFRYIGIRTTEPTPFKVAVIRARII